MEWYWILIISLAAYVVVNWAAVIVFVRVTKQRIFGDLFERKIGIWRSVAYNAGIAVVVGFVTIPILIKNYFPKPKRKTAKLQ